ncbi:c-type cytochrome [Denitratisoma oestradiolicum]|uniref:Cytochrome c-551 n=1 Tax=Denitratisoma oestradiolicum TaxID=311182 RepID=A0A6S6XWE4_9PROT|nr:c-type cytochrome [Denitratisoma oestradiolicum]TWO78936.1 cytochrome C biogenesis protein CcsA [Denitratisoma oestradiolicum]CAB1370319.1 Cytochrome c-551 [Denitratisoma oestradiolicum]
MKAMSVVLLATAGLMLSGPVRANEGLAKAKNCMACHAVDKKLVGPAYKEVAAKYAGKGRDARLVETVMKGGKGNWGEVPMPPNNVTLEEAMLLVAWVMDQK